MNFVDSNNQRLQNVGEPVEPSDGTNKHYVDNRLGGISVSAGIGLINNNNTFEVNSNLSHVTQLGNIKSATWSADTIDVNYGGTGAFSFNPNKLIVGNGTNPLQSYTQATFDNNLVTFDTPIKILNTTNSITHTSGGAITVFGGMGIVKDLKIGGQISAYDGTIQNLCVPGNFQISSIQSFSSNFTNLSVSNLQSNNNTLNNLSITNISGSSSIFISSTISNSYINIGTINNLTITSNLNSNSISTSNLFFSNASGKNIYISNSTLSNTLFLTSSIQSSIISNSTATNIYITNCTNTNLYSQNGNFLNSIHTNLTCSNGILNNITSNSSYINNLTSDNSNLTNILSINITSSNVLNTNLTNTNLINTNLSSSNLYSDISTINNLYNTNHTTSNLNVINTANLNNIMSNNITTNNITTISQSSTFSNNTNLNATNTTLTSLITNNITTSSLLTSNINSTFITSSSLSVINSNHINISTSNLNVTNINNTILTNSTSNSYNLNTTKSNIINATITTSSLLNSTISQATISSLTITNNIVLRKALNIGNNYSSQPLTSSGSLLTTNSINFTDNTTFLRNPKWFGSYFSKSTLSALNPNVKTTQAATVYIQGKPVEGINQTIDYATSLAIGYVTNTTGTNLTGQIMFERNDGNWFSSIYINPDDKFVINNASANINSGIGLYVYNNNPITFASIPSVSNITPVDFIHFSSNTSTFYSTSESYNLSTASVIFNGGVSIAKTLIVPNISSTNISTSTLNLSNGLTTGNINFTGTIYQNGSPYIGTQWITTNGNLFYTIGNIGIFTTAPSVALDVSGEAKITGTTSIGTLVSTLVTSASIGTPGATIGNIYNNNIYNNNIYNNNISTGTLNASNGITTGNINFTGTLYQNGTPYVSSQWTTTNGNLFYTTGNIGIFNTDPSVALDVNGSAHITETASIGTLVSTLVTSSSIGTPGATIGTVYATSISSATAQISGTISAGTYVGTLFSSGSIGASGATIGTVYATSITSGSVKVTNILTNNITVGNNIYVGGSVISVNITTLNLINNNISTSTLNATTITSGTYVGTLVSSGSIGASGATIGTVYATTVTSGTIQISGTISAGTHVGTLFSSGSIGASGATIGNIYNTNISTGTLNVSAGITTGNINFTGTLYKNGTPYASSQWTTTTNGNLFYTSGNIGIFNTAPSVALDVNGDIKASGNISAQSCNLSYLTTTNLSLTNFTSNNLIANNINIGVSSYFSGSFNASNNIITPSNVTGFILSDSIISFTATVTVIINASTNLYENFTINGTNTSTGWTLNYHSIGDASGIDFSINNSRQILYTSTNIPLYSSSTIRYSVNQISLTGNYNSLQQPTSGNTYIYDSIQLTNTTDSIVGVSTGAANIDGGVNIKKSLTVSSNISSSSLITTNATIGSLLVKNNVQSNTGILGPTFLLQNYFIDVYNVGPSISNSFTASNSIVFVEPGNPGIYGAIGNNLGFGTSIISNACNDTMTWNRARFIIRGSSLNTSTSGSSIQIQPYILQGNTETINTQSSFIVTDSGSNYGYCTWISPWFLTNSINDLQSLGIKILTITTGSLITSGSVRIGPTYLQYSS